MSRKPKHYLSFLLRLWQVTQNEEVVWRAALESVQTGERRSFADIGSLCDFLASEFTSSAHLISKEAKYET